ncbi:MAG: DotU family type IV/VI secretion system protein [Planctomycetota bacterium]
MLGTQMQDGGVTGLLIDLTAPWFLFLTTLQRKMHSQDHGGGASGGSGNDEATMDPATMDWVEGKVRGFLEDMRQAALHNPGLSVAIQEAKYPLVYFTIEVLQGCGWPEDPVRELRLFAPDTFDTQIGGEDFFTRARDLNPQNPEVIEIFFKCLCLGFKGRYADQLMRLREERERLMRRLPLDRISGPHFCPQAYEYTDTRDFVKLPMVATLRIAIAAVALICLIFWVSYKYTSSTLDDVGKGLKTIQQLNDDSGMQRNRAEAGPGSERTGR